MRGVGVGGGVKGAWGGGGAREVKRIPVLI